MLERVLSNLPADVVAQIEAYPPTAYLLDPAEKTDIPYVYINPQQPLKIDPKLPGIVVAAGPSGVGKDTVIEKAKSEEGIYFVVSATNRQRRIDKGEPEDAYVWMRAQRSGESWKSYVENLVGEYRLLEHDVHHGNVYGMPEVSLNEAIRQGIALVRVDLNGAETISSLYQGKANVMVVFIVPDNFEQIWDRIRGRDNALTRMRDSVGDVIKAPNVAHFYLHNGYDARGYSTQVHDSFVNLIKQKLKIF